MENLIMDTRIKLIYNFIIDNGGSASLSEIYLFLLAHPNVETKSYNSVDNFKAKIRQLIQEHSSDSITYKKSNPDLFYTVYGKGKGVWAVKAQKIS